MAGKLAERLVNRQVGSLEGRLAGRQECKLVGREVVRLAGREPQFVEINFAQTSCNRLAPNTCPPMVAISSSSQMEILTWWS